jgi:3-oxoacyl-[acyl-carrier protein] reductase
MFELKGKTALVTGAGQGVGAEIARVLAAHGAAVAVNDLYPERAEAVVGEIRKAGGRAATAPGDVGDYAAVQALCALAEGELAPIDILVNNAGLPVGPGFVLREFHQSGPEVWEPWLRVSLYGVLHCTRALLPGMRARRWGRIVTISSDAALEGSPLLAPYAAAKGGAVAFARALAREVGELGITCNCVALGLIEREQYAAEFPLEETLRRYPIRRMGRPADIAPLVLYLASEEASWVTGQIFAANGGAVPVR